jgi:hypothetical protein
MPDFDYHDALIQIEMLFQSHILSFGYKEYSLETFADKKYFSDWKGRERCADTDEMRAGLNIDRILQEDNPSDTEILTYLQYTLNIAELCRRSFNAEETPGYDFDIRNYTELLSRIRELLKRLNYDAKYVKEKDYIYLVSHDPALDAVESDEQQDPVSALITEYRSSSAVGQLDKKKDILKQLGDTVAEYDDNKKGASGRLYRRIEFLLESFNIEKGKEGETEDHPEVSAAIAKMNPQEVEEWYDETYQLLLLRVLEHSNLDRMQRVDDFAEKCGVENLEITEEEMAQLLSVKGVPEPPEKEEEQYPKLEDPEKEEAKLEKSEAREKERRSHTLRNVIAAIIIADILFVLFVLCYLFLR